MQEFIGAILGGAAVALFALLFSIFQPNKNITIRHEVVHITEPQEAPQPVESGAMSEEDYAEYCVENYDGTPQKSYEDYLREVQKLGK